MKKLSRSDGNLVQQSLVTRKARGDKNLVRQSFVTINAM